MGFFLKKWRMESIFNRTNKSYLVLEQFIIDE